MEQNLEELLSNPNPTTIDETQSGGETKEAPPIDVSAQVENIRTEFRNVFQDVIGDKERQIKELRSQLSVIEEEKNKPAPISIDPGDLVQDPNKVLAAFSQIVKDTIEKQVKPLQDFRTEILSERRFESATSNLKRHPQLGPIVDNYGEEIKRILSGNGQEITTETVKTAAMLIPGLIMTGQLENKFVAPANDTKPNTTRETPKVTGANIPPSAPNAPKRESTGAKLDMTDKEAQMARLLGMSQEEFIFYRDASTDPRTWQEKKKGDK
jgi:hypothetical protein